MARTSTLALATMACMNQRAVDAAIDSGALTKRDIAVVNGLRAGGGGVVAHRKLVGAIRKQFAERDQARKAIEAYARDRVRKETEMTLTDRVLVDRVEKARTEQKLYSDLIKAYQREHPGATRADCIDKVLFGAGAIMNDPAGSSVPWLGSTADPVPANNSPDSTVTIRVSGWVCGGIFASFA